MSIPCGPIGYSGNFRAQKLPPIGPQSFKLRCWIQAFFYIVSYFFKKVKKSNIKSLEKYIFVDKNYAKAFFS